MDNLSISIDPSQLQVSLEQTQGPPTTPQSSNRSPGKSSPLRGRCVKEYEEQLQQLQHENFNLKLRVFLLEERVGKALGRDAADIIKNNIELKVENETLKKSLTDKCQLLTQASGAIEDLESQQRSTLVAHQAEVLALREQLDDLQKELADAEEARLLSNRLPDESTDLYAQAFGSFVLNGQQQPSCNYPDHHSQEDVNALLAKIEELSNQLSSQAEEMLKLSSIVTKSEEEVLEYRQRVKYLETDVNQHQLRISQLEEDRSAKEAKINELMKEHDKDGRAVEKDKIIEEKQCQLEQQNKILVEIQITLDEKQKQIQELEAALNDRRKKVEELEKSLTKAGRTLQGFVADVQKKEKELELAKADNRKKDKRVKDLTAELKEAQELLNKAKWEAEMSSREDGVKAMAEEENERLWAELEEKKRLLAAAEHQKAVLQQEVNQLASLRQAVGQKEQAVLEAETQIATLKRQVAELQHEVATRSRLSMEKAQHSTIERKEMVATIQHQYEEAQCKVERLEKELERLKSWKKKTEDAAATHGGDHLLRMYKKEVTVLRQRLADSTNACDLLRTRLEEMADFLEEILSMSQQELMNLSNWSATANGDMRRQALQNSIMQSRELSRSLSASLMIGVDQPECQTVLEEEEPPLRTHSSSSVASTSAASSSWSLHSGNEKSWSDRQPISLPPPSELDIPDAPVPTEASKHQLVVDQLRVIVAQLEEKVKQRDAEIAWMNMERENNKRILAASNKSIQTEVDVDKNMISSTPYYPALGQGAHSFISPVTLGDHDASRSGSVTRALTLSQLGDSTKKTPESTPSLPAANPSESEAWSEPDRTVSFARMGLPSHHEAHNSIAALLSKKTRTHSATRDADSSSDSSVDSSKGTVRRSRLDHKEGKRSSKKLRAVEQENARLRSQLAEVIDSLRSTYDAQLVKDDSMLLEDSQSKEDSVNYSVEAPTTSGDVVTARYIIQALQGRLMKMKDLIRRREQRLRETKDLATQLELKLKEKQFQNCEMELQLREARGKLVELERRWAEAQSILVEKERLTGELRGALDAREMELRGALMKAQLWEDSYQTSQKNSRQKEAEVALQQELLVQSKSSLEQQVRLFTEELEALRYEKDALQSNLESVKEQLKNAEMMAQSRRTSQGLQRQVSQMSDYVSDQAISAEDVPPSVQTGKVSDQQGSTSRPSTLHLSPDLGIDSDPGRFSSLEHSAVEQKENIQHKNSWKDQQTKSSKRLTESPKKAEEKQVPDVLGITPNCPNCPRWQNKYAKAKQTLAATLEKLQAANLRKEKVDRALNKELGKTHNILCQARGILEQANQAGH